MDISSSVSIMLNRGVGQRYFYTDSFTVCHSFHQFNYLSIDQSIHPLIDVFIHSSFLCSLVHLSIVVLIFYQIACLFILHFSIHPVLSIKFIYLTLHLFSYPSISQPVYINTFIILLTLCILIVLESIHPFIFPSVHSSNISSDSFNQSVHYTFICCLLISCPFIFPMDK